MDDKKKQTASYEYEMRLRFSSSNRMYDDELDKLADCLLDEINRYCQEKGITNQTVIECDA